MLGGHLSTFHPRRKGFEERMTTLFSLLELFGQISIFVFPATAAILLILSLTRPAWADWLLLALAGSIWPLEVTFPNGSAHKAELLLLATLIIFQFARYLRARRRNAAARDRKKLLAQAVCLTLFTLTFSLLNMLAALYASC